MKETYAWNVPQSSPTHRIERIALDPRFMNQRGLHLNLKCCVGKLGDLSKIYF